MHRRDTARTTALTAGDQATCINAWQATRVQCVLYRP